MNYSFFLGANSKNGFYSLYDDLIDTKSADTVHIIKGSPGCGKSSFMRRIMKNLSKHGLSSESVLCASDPNSLDGVVFHDFKTAFVDGTAPHERRTFANNFQVDLEHEAHSMFYKNTFT